MKELTLKLKKNGDLLKINKSLSSFIAGLLLFSVLCSSCTKKNASDSVVQTINIGWIGPLSGPVSLLGTDNLKAVQLAIDSYNTKRKPTEPTLNLLIFDDQYQASKSREAYRQFVKDKGVRILFMSTYTSMFDLANNILRDNVVVINPIDSDANLSRLNQNMFFIAKQTEALGDIIVNALTTQNKKRTFILFFSGDDFMPFLAKHIEERFLANGGQVQIANYDSNTKDFDFFAQQSLNFQPDSYVLLGYSELGHFMKKVRSNGMKAPFYTPNVSMRTIAGEALEGTYFFNFTALDGNVELAKQFTSRYIEKYKEAPAVEWTAMQAYDATNILIHVLKQVSDKPGILVDHIKTQLFHTKHYSGVSGNISIRADGTTRGIKPNLYQFVQGKLIQKK